jgi:hypothetical protein
MNMKNILLFLLISLSINQVVFGQADNNPTVKMLFITLHEEHLEITLPHDHKIVEICPRPEKSLVALEANETNMIGQAFVIVYDLLGNKVYARECILEEGTCTKINLEHIQKGLYFMHLSNPSNSLTRKIILE